MYHGVHELNMMYWFRFQLLEEDLLGIDKSLMSKLPPEMLERLAKKATKAMTGQDSKAGEVVIKS